MGGPARPAMLVAMTSLSFAPAGSPPANAFPPWQVVDVELGEPLPGLDPHREDAPPCGGAHLLVRLHGSPIGTVDVAFDGGPVAPAELVALIDRELGPAIARHLADDAQRDSPGPGTASSGAPCLEDIRTQPGLPRATVLIATCRRPEQLEACLESVLRSDHPDFEVVVVDNSVGDTRTAERIRARYGDDDRVRLLEEPRPGTSRARNTGLAAAEGEIVAITDDDVEVDRSWLRTLAVTLDRHPDVACVTGLTQPYELETAAQAWFEQFSGMGVGFTRREYHLAMQPRPSLLFPFTPGVGGSNNMAVRTEVAHRLGGFDERLGPGTPTTGGEDLDLFVRILLGGQRIVYEPRAIVWHKHRRREDELRRHVFGYGAGALAVLTKWLLRRPELRWQLVRQSARLPSRIGTKGHRVGPATRPPRALSRAQVLGYACGPLLWLRSAALARRWP